MAMVSKEISSDILARHAPQNVFPSFFFLGSVNGCPLTKRPTGLVLQVPQVGSLRLCSPFPPGRGDSGFQVTGVIACGQKPKPKTIPRPKINPPKDPMPNLRALKLTGRIVLYSYNHAAGPTPGALLQIFSRLLGISKKSLLKSS